MSRRELQPFSVGTLFWHTAAKRLQTILVELASCSVVDWHLDNFAKKCRSAELAVSEFPSLTGFKLFKTCLRHNPWFGYRIGIGPLLIVSDLSFLTLRILLILEYSEPAESYSKNRAVFWDPLLYSNRNTTVSVAKTTNYRMEYVLEFCLHIQILPSTVLNYCTYNIWQKY